MQLEQFASLRTMRAWDQNVETGIGSRRNPYLGWGVIRQSERKEQEEKYVFRVARKEDRDPSYRWI